MPVIPPMPILRSRHPRCQAGRLCGANLRFGPSREIWRKKLGKGTECRRHSFALYYTNVMVPGRRDTAHSSGRLL